MAADIAEARVTGWYWRVIQPGRISPGYTLDRLQAAPTSPTLPESCLRSCLVQLDLGDLHDGLREPFQQRRGRARVLPIQGHVQRRIRHQLDEMPAVEVFADQGLRMQ